MPTKVHIVKAMLFPVITYGCESCTIKKLSTKELMFLNYGAGEDSREFHGQQGDPISPSWGKSTLNIHWKYWCWSSKTLATWCKEPTHWKRPDSGKDWGKEEKGATENEIVGWHQLLNTHEFKQTLGDSEGHGSLACCMQSMELQRVGRDWATEQQQQIVRKQKQIQATDYPTVKYNFRIFSHQKNGWKTADTGLTYGYTEVQLHCLIQREWGLSISGNKRYSNKFF